MHDGTTPPPDFTTPHKHKTIQHCTIPTLNNTSPHQSKTTQYQRNSLLRQTVTQILSNTTPKPNNAEPHQSITKHYKTKTLQHTTIPKLFSNTKTEPYANCSSQHFTTTLLRNMTLIFPPHQNFITRRHNTSTKLHKTPHYQDPTIPYITPPLPCASHHNITPQYDTSTKLHKTPHYQNISLRHNTHTWRYLTTTTQLVTHTIPQPYKTSRYLHLTTQNPTCTICYSTTSVPGAIQPHPQQHYSKLIR